MERKGLIKGHLKKAEEKLKAADIELGQGLYDEAVGAAYYAMFHASKAILLTKDISPRTHHGVIVQTAKEFMDSLERESLESLSWGLERRIKVDYDVLYDADKAEAEDAINRAEAFIKDIKEALKEQTIK